MSESMPYAEGHVVHLLQHWGDGTPPTELRIKPPLGSVGRFLLALILTAISAFGLGLLVILWTFPTPGWWFSLLFTVMIGGLVAALWATFVAALRSGVHRRQATARWREIRAGVRPSAGVILTRAVSISEDGSVSKFDVSVKTDQGTIVQAVWRPRPMQSASSRPLLQSQVPGVGAPARVWRTATTEPEPLVVEVLDPTVASDAGASGIDKYAD